VCIKYVYAYACVCVSMSLGARARARVCVYFSSSLDINLLRKHSRRRQVGAIASFLSLSSVRFTFVCYLYSEEKGIASSRTRARTHRCTRALTRTHAHTRHIEDAVSSVSLVSCFARDSFFFFLLICAESVL